MMEPKFRQVDPVEARTGVFLKSFDIGEYAGMLYYCGATKKAMKRHDITGEIVYTRIGMGTQERKFDTWQVFLINSE